MLDLVTPLITQLTPTGAPWLEVEGLLKLSELDDKTPRRLPKLYVIEMSERATPDVRGTGPYLQTVQLELGVVVVMASINGLQPSLTPIRERVRQRLFGWRPHLEAEPLALAGGSLLKIGSHYVAWLDRFITEYTEDAN
ncbi:hypothetical protein Sps_03448 [Shewanella psychrophila]|uniref:Uncharacterized protein n=1 Tax=Shewanella psychrophila TaxID=225848 RepID=A0A1S6HSS7_9GAMM|nr:hypothetical protein [Shewanella psychrophila]AQS38575.1 hypothetical protein Sps_03448 [Shewanella psychrophila]